MIELERLEWSHMYSYGADNVLDLNKEKITQLTAPNGTGKTSISLIIQELLFSKNIKKIKKGEILHRHSGAKSWSGNLYFKKDANDYCIKVIRTGASTKVTLLENGKDISEHKVPDTYKKVLDILGIDFDIFTQLNYQSSKNVLEFLLTTDAKRKQFLINLFKLNKYLEIGETAKFKLQQVEKQTTKLEGELEGVIKFLNEARIPEKKYEIDVPKIDEDLRTQQAYLMAEIKNHREKARSIDKNNILKNERDSISFDMNIEEFDYDTFKNKNTKHQIMASEIKTLQQEQAKIAKKIKDLDLKDTCYACGQTIDISHSLVIKNNFESESLELMKKEHEAKNVYLEIASELSSLLEDKKKYEENKKAIERFEQLSQLIDEEMDSTIDDFDKLEVDLRTINATIKTQEEEREKAQKHNESVRISNTKIEALVEQRREFLARQKLLEDDIIQFKSRVNDLTILRKAFSPSGIVAYKIENLTKELEDAINSYLAELSDGQFHIVFRLDGEKLNIVVIDQGVESPIETASDGEFSRIQTAVLLAIRKLLSNISGSYINLLFLDEITGVLDEAGKEKLIDVLREEKNLNVFLISHDLTHPLISKVNINKNDKISYIE